MTVSSLSTTTRPPATSTAHAVRPRLARTQSQPAQGVSLGSIYADAFVRGDPALSRALGNVRSRFDAKEAAAAVAEVVDARPSLRNKRVLVLSLSAGGGHNAAASAIKSSLGKGYDVKVVHPYDNGVEFYNAAQSFLPTPILNVLGFGQRLMDNISDQTTGGQLYRLLEEENPDVVISVVPMANGTLYKAAAATKTPLLVVPTDLEFDHFLQHIPSTPNPHFKAALPFDEMRNQAAHLPEHAFATTGYPVRRDFSTDTPVRAGEVLAPSAVLDELHIAPSDRVVMIMMGAGGASGGVIESDARALQEKLGGELQARAAAGAAIDPNQKVHVVAMCGSNDSLKTNLGSLSNGDGQVVVHAVGKKDAPDMAALMKKADVLVTKPGGGTVNEALAANLPMLYHRDNGGAVSWEVANAKFAEDKGLAGEVDAQDLVSVIADRIVAGRPTTTFDVPARNFAGNIKRVVDELIANTEKPVKSIPGMPV
jgi:processive 1,2-diacylglycerol beta-glucosyltransferase